LVLEWGCSDIITIQELSQVALVHSEHMISANTSKIGTITSLAPSHKESHLKGIEGKCSHHREKVLCRNDFVTLYTEIDIFCVRYLV
jgi:hypothetical protein